MKYSYQDLNLTSDKATLLNKVATFKLKDVFKGPYYCLLDIEDVVPVIIDNNPQPPSYDFVSIESLMQAKANYENRLNKLPAVSDTDPDWSAYDHARAKILKAIIDIDKAIKNHGQVRIEKFGEFRVRDKSPEVVIYLRSINSSSNPCYLCAETYIHEMFHAWNYLSSHQNGRSFREIEEPMVEFGMLYLLEKFSQSNTQYSQLFVDALKRVALKQYGIGSVAAYGFGRYLADKISKNKRAELLREYAKISDDIPSCFESIRIRQLLCPYYPIDQEKYCKSLFENIVYKKYNSLIPQWKGAKIVSHYYYEGNDSPPPVNNTDNRKVLFAIEFAKDSKIILHNSSYLNPKFAKESFIVYYGFDISKRFSIPDFVTSLESHVLFGTSIKKKFTVPDNVHYLRPRAFCDNKLLETIVFYGIIDCIPKETFKYCPNLKTVFFTPTDINPADTRKGDNSHILVVYESENTTHIGGDVFEKPIHVQIKDNRDTIPENFMKGCNNLIAIDYPDSIKRIEASAFAGCSKLDIEIKETITYIGDNAFSMCHNLSGELILPQISHLGKYAFLGTCFKSINLEDSSLTSLEEGVFSKMWGLKSIHLPRGLKSIGDKAFEGCVNLHDINIPSSVCGFGKKSFSNSAIRILHLEHYCIENIPEGLCQDMTELCYVKLPSSIKGIGPNAFNGCCSLIEINIPPSVKEIPKGAFHGCRNLVSVYLPNSIKEIGARAFCNCSELKTINIPASVSNIGALAFSDTAIGERVLDLSHNRIDTISEGAFQGWRNLVSVYLPNSIKEIGARAFCNCSELKTINIPSSVTIICSSAFSGTRISSLDLTSNPIEDIPKEAFSGMEELTSLYLPSCVKRIDSAAFSKTIIEHLDLSQTNIKEITTDVFSGMSSLKSINWPQNIRRLNAQALSWCSIDNYTFPESVNKIETNDFRCSTTFKRIDLSITNITSIPDEAFYGCRELQCLMLPKHLESIGARAFQACHKIKSLEVPTTVSKIKNSAFRLLSELQELSLENCHVEVIENELFQDCRKLEKVLLPRMMKSIGKDVFKGCISIKEIWAPLSMKSEFIRLEIQDVIKYYG